MANELGRPETITPEIEAVLKEAFAIGCSDKEAMAYASDKLSTKDKPVHIAESVFYDYQKRHPDFLEQKEALKLRPTLKARNSVVAGLNEPEFALKYLSKKKRDEFGDRLDLTTNGKDLVNNQTINLSAFTQEELDNLEQLTRKAISTTNTDTERTV